ncbi:MAG: metallophosphoesterase, partial [Planctomycetes bacterium]|nr:metallophosphoesterase [Planctomycetota bacterium]
VETLPMTTRVDFAQYTEVTEFLTTATVPVGTYTQAKLTLDYASAEIWVENAAGDGVQVPAANIVDDTGAALGTIEVTVQFDSTNRLVIAPGIPAQVTLDFDLASSNQVEFSGATPTVTVQPVLVAGINRESLKVHRLRGPLRSVDAASQTFRVIIRPFLHALSGAQEEFGTLPVMTDVSTVFEIDGQPYVGDAGLNELASLPTLTAVIVMGEWNVTTRRYEADQVYAGSSVPGGTLDVVSGNVTARSGNQLTVKGATLIRASGSVIFRNEVTIDIGTNTTVTRQHSTSLGAIGDISVGQRVVVFGDLDGTDTVLDADFPGALAHQLITTLRATVTQVSPLEVELVHIDGRPVSIFDFTGTGIDAPNDADPDAYHVDPGTLSLAGAIVGTPIKIRGFVTPFGHAASAADFEARTVIDLTDVPGLFTVDWFPSSTTAVSGVAASGLDLDLTGVGLFHHINRLGHIVDLATLSSAPSIIPDATASGHGVFAITRIAGPIQVFFEFDDFAAALDQHLDSGRRVRSVVGIGRFEDSTATLTGTWLNVRLN